MKELVLNEEHLDKVLARMYKTVRHRLFIATADVKDVHFPPKTLGYLGRGKAVSVVEVFGMLVKKGIEIRLLHSGVPSGPFLHRIRQGVPKGLIMRRCPRVHTKAVIVDGRWMYIGSANLTGAGLGAKSTKRRNFEVGICTEDATMVDAVVDNLHSIFSGRQCLTCDRKKHCPIPLEEPE